jgi:nitronate monooxygenase
MTSGADLVYMGTRFIPTTESMAPPAYKQMVVDSNVDDLVVSAGVTGTAASWLKQSLRDNGLDPDNMPASPPRNYDSNTSFAGKKWLDVWAAGQGLGSIKAVQPVSAVVDQLDHEYGEALARARTLR